MEKALIYSNLKIFRVSTAFREKLAENYKAMKNSTLRVRKSDFLAHARVIIYLCGQCVYIYKYIHTCPPIDIYILGALFGS